MNANTTTNQKNWEAYMLAIWSIWGMSLACFYREISGTGGVTAPPSPMSLLDDEQDQDRDDERDQAQKLGGGEADEQAALLTVGGTRIAQRAFEERAEHVAHAERGQANADCREA